MRSREERRIGNHGGWKDRAGITRVWPQRRRLRSVEEWTEDYYINSAIIRDVLRLSPHDFTVFASWPPTAKSNSILCILKSIFWADQNQLGKRRFQRLYGRYATVSFSPPPDFQRSDIFTCHWLATVNDKALWLVSWSFNLQHATFQNCLWDGLFSNIWTWKLLPIHVWQITTTHYSNL